MAMAASLPDQAPQQVVEQDLRIDLDEHPRTRGTPRLFADRHGIVERCVAANERVESEIGRHELGQARRVELGLGIGLAEHDAARCVDEVVGFGVDLGKLAGESRGGNDERNREQTDSRHRQLS